MKLKNIIAIVLSALMLVSVLSGCKNDKKDNETASDSSTESKMPETDEEWHNAMIEKSMVTYGNATAMQEKIKKAQAGEEVTVAYLGGSITEGLTAGPSQCWARLTYEHFAEKYGTGENVKYCNAGLSGTPSKLGILRLKRDVLVNNPDICFVEFAVNDADDGDHRNAYESIVRDLLEKDVAVVLLFSVTEQDYSCQDYMKAIGNHYQLPMISYCDALRYMFENNSMTWKDFSDDQSHPNVYGHELVAEMVNHYFDTVTDVESEAYTMPSQPLNTPRQSGADIYENTNLKPESSGSWEDGSTISDFKNGWSHQENAGNKPLVLKFKAKFAYLIYKEVGGGDKYGKAHIKITCNGEPYNELELNSVHSSGWGNPEIMVLGMQTEAMEYEVEISMADGNENKLFQVLGIGYTM